MSVAVAAFWWSTNATITVSLLVIFCVKASVLKSSLRVFGPTRSTRCFLVGRKIWLGYGLRGLDLDAPAIRRPFIQFFLIFNFEALNMFKQLCYRCVVLLTLRTRPSQSYRQINQCELCQSLSRGKQERYFSL